MKIQFDASLGYQQAAISAVVDVFRGAQHRESPFTVVRGMESSLFASIVDGVGTGYGNSLTLLPDELLANIREVQRRGALPLSTSLGPGLNLDVEMETGTGKTYVYLRTILELNKAYGFTKFIIVVPSTAIKEGVEKTLDITREHFRALYQNVIYDYFVYDGAHVERLRDFAVSTDIEIMVINIDSFQKSGNIINRASEKFSGTAPIELVRATRPLVIIDEPQSSISSEARVQAVEELAPLCTIRYSATPIRVENRIYKLDAVDSYEQKLVKSIDVTSFAVKNDHNEAYMQLKSVNNRSGGITAQLELDVQGRNGLVKRKSVKVRRGDDLEELSGRRAVYRNMRINDIFYEDDVWKIELSNSAIPLVQGRAIGTAADDELKKQQIRATIIEHLDKELELNPLGIKVLSLFFIDRVANYRTYDENGEPQKGKYARWFEEIYTETMREEKYHSLFHELHNETDEAALVHDGYFSQDKARKTPPRGGRTRTARQRRTIAPITSSCGTRSACYHLTRRYGLFSPTQR